MTSRKHVVIVYIFLAFLLILNAGQLDVYLTIYNQAKALAWKESQKTDFDSWPTWTLGTRTWSDRSEIWRTISRCTEQSVTGRATDKRNYDRLWENRSNLGRRSLWITQITSSSC